MPNTAELLWQRAVTQLREVIPERTIDNWLVGAVPHTLDEEGSTTRITLRVSSQFCRDYILSNFRREIEETLGDLKDQSVELTLRVDPSISDESTGDSPSPGDARTPDQPHTPAPASSAPSTSDAPSRPADETAHTPSEDRGAQEQTSKRSAPAHQSERPVAANKSAPFSPEGLPASRRAEPETQEVPSPSPSLPETEAAPPAARTRSRNAEDGAPSSSTPSSEHFQFSEDEQSLRSGFTFDQFLEGDSNRLARSASVAVAKKPGVTKYNPLVVYGDVGLGKTHLAQAIANHALKHKTASSICYVSSERFTSQFVTAIREDNFSAFSSHYRSVDLLVVDDVQFFGGKEKTQEEFFHLFNDLHQHGKQIVLCADRPPSKITGIEDRLLSRFQWGLTADIQQPDLEMRMAVLQLKAEHLDLDVEPDVLELIAQNITENIRQLEGALKQLAARAQLIDGAVDTRAAKEILEREYDAGGESRQATVEDIIDGVASFHSLSSDELVSRTRRQKISNARQVAMYLSREMTNLSYASIGLRFGGRDHSTVIHAYRKVKDQLQVRPDFEKELDAIRSEIRSHLFSG